nr:LysR substrate-binding domain-containing protein [Streptomyces cupreus]
MCAPTAVANWSRGLAAPLPRPSRVPASDPGGDVAFRVAGAEAAVGQDLVDGGEVGLGQGEGGGAGVLLDALRACFACRSCGFVDHADLNGSRNIRARAWELWRRGAESTAPAPPPRQRRGAGRKPDRPDPALDGPFVLPHRGLVREAADRWFRARGTVPDVACEPDGHEGLLTLVALGCGTGVVPSLVLEHSAVRDRLSVLPADPPPEDFPIGLCVRRADLRRPSVAALWSLTASQGSGPSAEK